MGHKKVNVEANFSYRSTKYGTRRNPFMWTTQKMALEETLLYGPTKRKLEETLLYGPTKNETIRNPFI